MERIEFQREHRERDPAEDLVVVTTTLYKDDPSSSVREELAKEFFRKLETQKIDNFVVDGGSDQEFALSFSKLNHAHIEIHPDLTMGASRRQAITNALEQSDKPYLLWLEPEKTGVLEPGTLHSMLDVLRRNEADIVIPKRRTKETYPKFQAWIESRGNKNMTKLLGLGEEEIDFWFGPRMFNRDSAQYFLESDAEKWDAIFLPLVEALHDGKRIGSVDIDYSYPTTQREIEEREHLVREFKQKRLDQYRTILTSIQSLRHNA